MDGAQAIEAAGRIFAAVARAVGEAFQQVARSVGPLLEQMEQAGAIEKSLPKDPMLRALELRRNRNTGPAQPVRVPRRIDPRRDR